MAWPDDNQRRVTLHVSAFNTPMPNDSEGEDESDVDESHDD
jgi:hypothetical protein